MSFKPWIALGFVLCAGRSIGAPTAEPPKKLDGLPCYDKKGTWWETVLASREALARQGADAERQAEDQRQADPALRTFQPLRVEMRGADEPRKIKVRVAGLKRIFIGARGPDEAFFGDPELHALNNQPASLSIATARRIGGAGFRHHLQPQGWKPIVWRERTFDRGAVLHNTEIVLELGESAEWMETWIGVRGQRESRPVAIWIEWRSILEGEAKSNAAREAIDARVSADFPTPLDVRQRRLEAAAGIWQADWRPGDLAHLAGRYAAVSGAKDRPTAHEGAKRCDGLPELKAIRGLFYAQHAEKRLALARKTLDLVERAAPQPQWAAALAALERQPADGESLYAQACGLRRQILLSHPALDFDRLLINKRTGSLPEHMCDQYLGRHSQKAAGLVVLDHWKDTPRETLILEGKLPPGALIHPDLSYDAKRVLFAFADHSSPRGGNLRGYSLFEYSFESGEVRQITGTSTDPMRGQKDRHTALIEDMDPCYLPDGGIAFISTRSQQYGRCHGGRYVPSYTLFRAELDGTGIRPLSFNESNEWGPAVLHDGLIVYTRWDYVNRHDVLFQSLWVIHPDGTQTAHYYGNNSPAPCLIGETQPIPGTHKAVATAAAHHGQTLGTLIVIDPHRGQDHGEPLTWLTPELGFPESGIPRGITRTEAPLADDLPSTTRGAARAGTPWPISDELFFCAYQHGNQYAVYLIDVLGGRELIYADAKTSCFDPVPLRPRPAPPIIPSAVAGRESQKTGVFYVQDVYRASHPIERGSIKRLRINEIISQPTSSAPVRSRADNEVVKRILGTVPVNDDGSVAFEAPANTPFQLQLLDQNGMAVMTMRSLVYLQPGERASCTGCHEPRSSAPPAEPSPRIEVRQIVPPAGPRYEGGFSFTRTVQPVLDRYCIGCHGLDRTDKDLVLLGSFAASERKLPDGRRERVTPQFSAAYMSLLASGLVKIAPRNGESFPSRPKDYFAHAGRLAPMLLKGHPDSEGRRRVELDPDSFQRIVDWLDVNAQCYGDYSFNRVETRPPDPEGEQRLREAIVQRLGPELARQPYAALVNVANPPESRVLMAALPAAAGGWGQISQGAYSSRDDPAWQEMLKQVERSIMPLAHVDIASTCGREQGCRCGVCWVRKDRASRQPQDARVR